MSEPIAAAIAPYGGMNTTYAPSETTMAVTSTITADLGAPAAVASPTAAREKPYMAAAALSGRTRETAGRYCSPRTGGMSMRTATVVHAHASRQYVATTVSTRQRRNVPSAWARLQAGTWASAKDCTGREIISVTVATVPYI